jgi:hypothetical protein
MPTEPFDHRTAASRPGAPGWTERPWCSEEPEEALKVFRAETDADREAVYRFRYAVYVEEMGRYRSTADHQRKMLIDPEDAHSVIYVARQRTEVVGTLRTTFGEDGYSARQITQYSLEPFLAEIPARIMCVSERLMVAPHLRGSPVMAAMRDHLGELIEDRHVRIMFGDCEPHFLSHNLAMGSRPYAARNINSEDAGYLIPLITFIGGTDGLAEAIAGPKTELPPVIQRVVAGTGGITSSVTDPQTYRTLIGPELKQLGRTDLHTFAGFDDQELQQCLQGSTIISCAAGDRLVKKGGSSDNLFVVLQGTLQVRDANTAINTLSTGDVFGETAFLLGVPRQRDVVALTDDVVLVELGVRGVR